MTIDELNRRYGAPERIVFRAGHCGYPEVALCNKYGVAEVALLGANTLSYRPTGHSPVIFRSGKRDYNRGDAFHGGIPVCWPQFGRLAIPGMAAHGFARIMPFSVRKTEYTEEITEITLGLVSDSETKKLFPADFDLEVKISVSMKLNLYLTTRNTGEKPFAFTAGFHPYFLVGERDSVVVKGLDNCEYVFAETMARGVQKGDLTMETSRDHVFEMPSAVKYEYALIDPKLRRAIAMASAGNSSLVVWNPGPDGKFADLGVGDWRKFVCAEPVTAWPQAKAMLQPGQSNTLMCAIQSVAEGAASDANG